MRSVGLPSRDVTEILTTDDYLSEHSASLAEFWRRFGNQPAFAGLDVLDIGCGRGVMSLQVAEAGAARVLGVDLNARAVARGRDAIDRLFPHVAERVELRGVDVADLPGDQQFDAAVSKDTFEHLADLPAVLAAVYRVLRPGGRLYAGFSPLFHSPFGDHDRTGLRNIPWAHTLLPRRIVLRSAARYFNEHFDTLLDLGLNGMAPAQYRAAFADSSFEVESLLYNQGGKRLLTVLEQGRKLRPLEKYCTVSIYAVLRKPASSD